MSQQSWKTFFQDNRRQFHHNFVNSTWKLDFCLWRTKLEKLVTSILCETVSSLLIDQEMFKRSRYLCIVTEWTCPCIVSVLFSGMLRFSIEKKKPCNCNPFPMRINKVYIEKNYPFFFRLFYWIALLSILLNSSFIYFTE